MANAQNNYLFYIIVNTKDDSVIACAEAVKVIKAGQFLHPAGRGFALKASILLKMRFVNDLESD